jgi:acetyl esterase/lipase
MSKCPQFLETTWIRMFKIRHLAMAFISFLMITIPAVSAVETSSGPEKISLWGDLAPVGNGTFGEGASVAGNGSITVYHPAKPNGASVVICPGGGYGRLVMEQEGHGIARWLNRYGITGVVLGYRLPHGNPALPLFDAQRAVRMVRSKAQEWGCDPKRVGIMGFSAGGHLASTAATHFDDGDSQAKDPIDQCGSRPDFAILIYPVIATVGPPAHAGSRNNLLGPNPKPELVESFSNERQVTDQTPPAFLAHAQDDTVVPAENSQMFYDALRSHQVPATYLKLPTGGHGLNGYKGPMWDAWQTESLKWLASQGIIPPA